MTCSSRASKYKRPSAFNESTHLNSHDDIGYLSLVALRSMFGKPEAIGDRTVSLSKFILLEQSFDDSKQDAGGLKEASGEWRR